MIRVLQAADSLTHSHHLCREDLAPFVGASLQTLLQNTLI